MEFLGEARLPKLTRKGVIPKFVQSRQGDERDEEYVQRIQKALLKEVNRQQTLASVGVAQPSPWVTYQVRTHRQETMGTVKADVNGTVYKILVVYNPAKQEVSFHAYTDGYKEASSTVNSLANARTTARKGFRKMLQSKIKGNNLDRWTKGYP